MPVANVITAVPISPSGWGVGEEAYRQLFILMGGAGALGVAVSVTIVPRLMVESQIAGPLQVPTSGFVATLPPAST